MFMRERLRALKDGWEELHQMWENRQVLLSQSLDQQLFNRDGRQAEVLLSQQEHFLSKDDTPVSLEQAENQLKRHEAFLTTMEANDDKINTIVQVADQLIDKDHFDADKIKKRAEIIDQRRTANRDNAIEQQEKLINQVKLHVFLQDLEELTEWVQEKFVISQDETYRSAKTIHSKWTRHQAFEAEIAANKERLYEAEKRAEELVKEKPEFSEIIEPKLKELSSQFEDLEKSTKEKGAILFDSNREVLVHQTCDDIDSYLTDIEKQIIDTDTGNDLTSVNILIQKQHVIETQMLFKAKQIDEIDKQTDHLQKTISTEQVEPILTKKVAVVDRFTKIKEPLIQRQIQLQKKKEAFQFRRDVEDEKLWIDEKMPQANYTDFGNSLFNVHSLKKKHQSLANEIDNHEARIMSICNNGQKLIDEGHEDAPLFAELIKQLTQKWQDLKDSIEDRKNSLDQSEKVGTFLFLIFRFSTFF